MILVQEIIREVVERVSLRLNRNINFVCGDAQYVKDQLDDISKAPHGGGKYPLFVLYMPIVEDKTQPDCYCKVSLRILIATLSQKGYDYSQRLEYSFKEQLHPIYEAFMDELRAEKRLNHAYTGVIPHNYVDNYQYGYHGTVAGDDTLYDSIDGIDITNLKLTVRHYVCEKLSRRGKV